MESQSTSPLLYCWGKNKEGELSLGHTKSISKPRTPKLSSHLFPVSISCGGSHTGLVSADGSLHLTGSSLHSKLGFESLDQTCLVKFRRLDELSDLKVKQVACGDYHTLCLLESGKLYAWGGTLHKKLGQRSGRPAPISKLESTIITKVDCGDFHSAALSSSNTLYTWGGGGAHFNKGQLGHGNLHDYESPELLKSLENSISSFSCGGFHTIAVLLNGTAMAWGSGTYGELGIGEYVDALSPRQVQGISEKISSTICGGHHSLFITESTQNLYSCGYGSHGQLGLKTTCNYETPQLVFALSNKMVDSASAGWNHSIVVTNDSAVYSCGYNSSGQLGLGDIKSRTSFTLVTELKYKRVEKVFCGGNFSWVLLNRTEPEFGDKEARVIEELRVVEKKKDGEGEGDIKEILNKFSNDPLFGEKGVLVCECEVSLCHCFCVFQLKLREKELMAKVNSKVNEFVEKYSQEVAEVKHYSLRENTEVMMTCSDDEAGHQFPSTNSSQLSFTFMMITKLPDTPMPLTNDNSTQKITSTTIGDLTFIPFDQFPDSQQFNQKFWPQKLMADLNSLIHNQKFFELRPLSEEFPL